MSVMEKLNSNKNKEKLNFKGCNEKTIHCRKCMHSLTLGASNSRCDIYYIKPLDVYYNNSLCPSFKIIIK